MYGRGPRAAHIASRPYFATNGSSDSDGGESTGDESDNDRQDGENEEDEDEEESGHVAFTLGLETMHGQARDHSEPKKAADEAENAVARVPQASMCAICLEDLIADDDPAAALSCGHVYHTTCISTFAKSIQRPKINCPSCKQHCPKQYLRLYFNARDMETSVLTAAANAVLATLRGPAPSDHHPSSHTALLAATQLIESLQSELSEVQAACTAAERAAADEERKVARQADELARVQRELRACQQALASETRLREMERTENVRKVVSAAQKAERELASRQAIADTATARAASALAEAAASEQSNAKLAADLARVRQARNAAENRASQYSAELKRLHQKLSEVAAAPVPLTPVPLSSRRGKRAADHPLAAGDAPRRPAPPPPPPLRTSWSDRAPISAASSHGSAIMQRLELPFDGHDDPPPLSSDDVMLTLPSSSPPRVPRQGYQGKLAVQQHMPGFRAIRAPPPRVAAAGVLKDAALAAARRKPVASSTLDSFVKRK